MAQLQPNDPAETIARANLAMQTLHGIHSTRDRRIAAIHPDAARSSAYSLENDPKYREAKARMQSAEDATRVGDEGATMLRNTDLSAFL